MKNFVIITLLALFLKSNINAQCSEIGSPSEMFLTVAATAANYKNPTLFDFEKVRTDLIKTSSTTNNVLKYKLAKDAITNSILQVFDAMESTNSEQSKIATYSDPNNKYSIEGKFYCKKTQGVLLQRDYAYNNAAPWGCGEINPQGIHESELSLNMRQFPRMLIVRHNAYANTGKIPTIILTHGSPFDASAKNQKKVLSFITDFVLRGYNVVFYESSSSCDLYVAGTVCPPPVSECLYPIPFQRAIYTGYQHAYAALQYILNNKKALKVDTENLFAYSGSFGGFSLMSLAYADSDNFTNEIFHNIEYGTDLGTKSKLIKSGLSDYGEFTLKGLCTIAAGLPDSKNDGNPYNDSKIGDIFDANVRKTPFLLLHGGKDLSILVNEGYVLNDTFTNPLNLKNPENLNYSGSLDLLSQLNNRQIWNQAIINCYGGHGFTIPQIENAVLSEYENRQSLHVGYMIAHFFRKLKDGQITQGSVCDGSNNIIGVKTIGTPDIGLSCSFDLITTNSTLNPNKNGYFTEFDCPCSTDPNFYRIAANGNKEYAIGKSGEILAYPNPNNGNQLFVELPISIDSFRIDLYDQTGKLCRSLQSTNSKETIDLKNLPTGMYLLKTSNDKFLQTQKILIQK